jgi:hypothetical protein
MFLRRNGARERSIIQFTDLLSHGLSLEELIPQRNYLDDRSGEQY